MVSSCANAILTYGHTGSDTAPLIGDHWAPNFLNHHPEYHVRKQQTIDSDRKNIHQPANICIWFDTYKTGCEEHDIKPGDQYNFDKTGFHIDVDRN